MQIILNMYFNIN